MVKTRTSGDREEDHWSSRKNMPVASRFEILKSKLVAGRIFLEHCSDTDFRFCVSGVRSKNAQ